MNDAEYRQLLGKARDAKRGGYGAWCVQSTGERVSVALVLNKPEWLAEMGYSLAEAIDRAGHEWIALVPIVARQVKQDDWDGGSLARTG
jgi:hypothetical protein